MRRRQQGERGQAEMLRPPLNGLQNQGKDAPSAAGCCLPPMHVKTDRNLKAVGVPWRQRLAGFMHLLHCRVTRLLPTACYCYCLTQPRRPCGLSGRLLCSWGCWP